MKYQGYPNSSTNWEKELVEKASQASRLARRLYVTQKEAGVILTAQEIDDLLGLRKEIGRAMTNLAY